MLAPREKLWPASLPIVRKALSLLNLTPMDRLADYGCGNGIALFTATEEFHVEHAYGYEIYEPRALELINEIKEKHLEAKITVRIQNALDADPTEPTAVYLYLISRGLELLLPLLRTIAGKLIHNQYKLRVVTVLYKIPNIPYEKMEKVYTSDIAMTPIYLYTITPDTGISLNSFSSTTTTPTQTTTTTTTTADTSSSSTESSANNTTIERK